MAKSTSCHSIRHKDCIWSSCSCFCHNKRNSEITQPAHQKYIVVARNLTESQCYDSLQDAEDKAAELLKVYPHLQVAIYQLKQVGKTSTPPVVWTHVAQD